MPSRVRNRLKRKVLGLAHKVASELGTPPWGVRMAWTFYVDGMHRGYTLHLHVKPLQEKASRPSGLTKEACLREMADRLCEVLAEWEASPLTPEQRQEVADDLWWRP